MSKLEGVATTNRNSHMVFEDWAGKTIRRRSPIPGSWLIAFRHPTKGRPLVETNYLRPLAVALHTVPPEFGAHIAPILLRF